MSRDSYADYDPEGLADMAGVEDYRLDIAGGVATVTLPDGSSMTFNERAERADPAFTEDPRFAEKQQTGYGWNWTIFLPDGTEVGRGFAGLPEDMMDAISGFAGVKSLAEEGGWDAGQAPREHKRHGLFRRRR